MMQLTREDGVTYRLRSFEQEQGKATATLTLPGIEYPTSLGWLNCTVQLGDKMFEGVRAIVQEVYMYDPTGDDVELAAYTTYGLALLFAKDVD